MLRRGQRIESFLPIDGGHESGQSSSHPPEVLRVLHVHPDAEPEQLHHRQRRQSRLQVLFSKILSDSAIRFDPS